MSNDKQYLKKKGVSNIFLGFKNKTQHTKCGFLTVIISDDKGTRRVYLYTS